jgi:hypothetical protein
MGICMRLAGGMIAYKTKFQPTVAMLSTEAEFMATCDASKMIFGTLTYPRKLLPLPMKTTMLVPLGQMLRIPPHAHDIWTSNILLFVTGLNMILERIDTKINLADPFTKLLYRALFHRHVDFILGHIPTRYPPVYSKLIGAYTDQHTDIDEYVPGSFTTPLRAAAARIYTLLWEDYIGNPWVHILWHG